LREGDNETTCDKLIKSKLNSNKHQQGTWREDLHHIAKNCSRSLNNCVISFLKDYILITVALGGIYHVYTHFVALIKTKNPLFY
jgi:hypothetical protein